MDLIWINLVSNHGIRKGLIKSVLGNGSSEYLAWGGSNLKRWILIEEHRFSFFRAVGNFGIVDSKQDMDARYLDIAANYHRFWIKFRFKTQFPVTLTTGFLPKFTESSGVNSK